MCVCTRSELTIFPQVLKEQQMTNMNKGEGAKTSDEVIK